MNLKLDVEWIIKAAACAVWILAGFGKIAAIMVGADPNSTGIVGSVALGLGLYAAAPLIGGLLKKPTT